MSMKFSCLPRALLIVVLIMELVSCQSKELSMGSSNDLKLREHRVSAHQAKGLKPSSLDSRIETYLRFNEINGTVAIVKNKRLIFNEGIGYTDIKTRSLNQPGTTYPIGSITKTFVATSIIQLQEKGKLSIKDPVSKYFPHFPNGKRMRLIHLLTHTSGIQPPRLRIGIRSPLDLIQRVEERSVQFPAGTRWDYRDENYAILGYIVEKVSGMALHQYIEKNIFTKAGMKHSGFITQRNPVPYTSNGYIKEKRQFIAKGVSNWMLFGFGDIYATAEDICLYDEALMNGKLVSPASLKTMLKPRSKSGYGLGLYHNGYAVYSRGVMGGFEAFHIYYDKDHTSITILTNIRNKNVDIHRVGSDIHKLVTA